jgi:hypothetical protein
LDLGITALEVEFKHHDATIQLSPGNESMHLKYWIFNIYINLESMYQ